MYVLCTVYIFINFSTGTQYSTGIRKLLLIYLSIYLSIYTIVQYEEFIDHRVIMYGLSNDTTLFRIMLSSSKLLMFRKMY